MSTWTNKPAQSSNLACLSLLHGLAPTQLKLAPRYLARGTLRGQGNCWSEVWGG